MAWKAECVVKCVGQVWGGSSWNRICHFSKSKVVWKMEHTASRKYLEKMTPFRATLSSFSDVTIQDLMLERLTKRECLQKYLLWEGEWDIHISKLKISSNVITFASWKKWAPFIDKKCTYWKRANKFRYSKTNADVQKKTFFYWCLS